MPDPTPSPVSVPAHDAYGEGAGGWRAPRWGPVRRRLEQARYYWIGFVSPRGDPRATPVWSLWLDGAFYATIGPTTMLGRSLAVEERVVIHLENAHSVVAVEGRLRRLDPANVPAVAVDGYAVKYGWPMPTDDPDMPWFRLAPTVARTWSDDIRATVARWTFPADRF